MSGYGELVATNDLTGLAHTARLDVLFTGYAADRVAGTVSLIRDGDRVIVVDPGMVPARAAILDPLEELGVSPHDVTDVVLSHHHPNTINLRSHRCSLGGWAVRDSRWCVTRVVWRTGSR